MAIDATANTIFLRRGHAFPRNRRKSQINKLPVPIQIQWNVVIKRSDITKPSYNKVILLVPALYICGASSRKPYNVREKIFFFSEFSRF